MSQYSHVPIGNISNDFSIFALDILYARQLKLKNYLLWASLSSKPDFGGKELHDWRFGNEWEIISFSKNSGYIFNKETFDVIFLTFFFYFFLINNINNYIKHSKKLILTICIFF